MDLQTVGLLLVAWTVLGLIVAILFGAIARHSQPTLDQGALEDAADTRRVLRYMRKTRTSRKPQHEPAAQEAAVQKAAR